jgi:hypothetical protein
VERLYAIGLVLICATSAIAQTETKTVSVVTAGVFPPANPRGWHSTALTVTFACAQDGRVTSCRQPVVFSEQGVHRLRLTTGTTMLVKLDTTPPSVRLSEPLDGMATSASTMTVVASVADELSGLAKVTCNGRTARVERGVVRCAVPLSPGVNAVVVHAMDQAGNSASAGARVTREDTSGRLLVTPDVLTLRSDGADVLRAVTVFGVGVKGITWESSDPTIVSVDSYDDYAQVNFHAAGEVVITAHDGDRTAVARVIAVPTDPVPPGTTNWALSPAPGRQPRPPITASRVDDGPDFFAVDVEPSGESALVRGLTNRGSVISAEVVPGVPLRGDQFGGLLAQLAPSGGSHVIGRFDRPYGAALVWRFEAQGQIAAFSQSEDGTLYLVERVTPSATRSPYINVVVVDGRTGLARGRFPVPDALEIGPVLPLDDGTAYAEVVESRSLQLVRITAESTEVVRTLWRPASSGSRDRTGVEEKAVPSQVMVTPSGEMLAFWTHVEMHPDAPLTRLHVTRIVGQRAREVVHEIRQSGQQVHALVDAFDEAWLYLSDGTAVVAIDLPTGAQQWSLETAAQPILALDGRHVLLNDLAGGRVIELDSSGATVRTIPVYLEHPRVVVAGNDILHGVDPETRSVVEVEIPSGVDSGWFANFDLRTR